MDYTQEDLEADREMGLDDGDDYYDDDDDDDYY
jgi:hypothetical protein